MRRCPNPERGFKGCGLDSLMHKHKLSYSFSQTHTFAFTQTRTDEDTHLHRLSFHADLHTHTLGLDFLCSQTGTHRALCALDGGSGIWVEGGLFCPHLCLQQQLGVHAISGAASVRALTQREADRERSERRWGRAVHAGPVFAVQQLVFSLVRECERQWKALNGL